MSRPFCVHTIAEMFGRDCSARMPDGSFVQAVCEPWHGGNFKAAWWVLTGRAYAVLWPKPGDLERAIAPLRPSPPRPDIALREDIRKAVNYYVGMMFAGVTLGRDVDRAAKIYAEAHEFMAEALMAERLAERERCAIICDKEVAAMQRVADFHRPPRVDYDPELADMHDQGATVAFKLAAAIRSQS